MRKILYELFTGDTDSLSYLKTTAQFLIGILFPVGIFFLANLIPVGHPFRFVVLIPVYILLWMSLIYFVSLIHVSDNRELVNIKGENYKYIYKPIKLPIEDFVFWLDNAEIPETLYLRSKNGINYKFDISFNTKGKSSPFYNKEFLLDNKKIAHEDCLSVLQDLEIISKDHIKIYETFDRNPPELCIKIIDDLKSKK